MSWTEGEDAVAAGATNPQGGTSRHFLVQFHPNNPFPPT